VGGVAQLHRQGGAAIGGQHEWGMQGGEARVEVGTGGDLGGAEDEDVEGWGVEFAPTPPTPLSPGRGGR
jgi:hypothetical protein